MSTSFRFNWRHFLPEILFNVRQYCPSASLVPRNSKPAYSSRTAPLNRTGLTATR
ncbi:hypothetical protein IFO70_26490 [Phormidium tenue FACHB-886]|nr:hypothetical protein [Phormidium tenue FACHB-886]